MKFDRRTSSVYFDRMVSIAFRVEGFHCFDHTLDVRVLHEREGKLMLRLSLSFDFQFLEESDSRAHRPGRERERDDVQ